MWGSKAWFLLIFSAAVLLFWLSTCPPESATSFIVSKGGLWGQNYYSNAAFSKRMLLEIPAVENKMEIPSIDGQMTIPIFLNDRDDLIARKQREVLQQEFGSSFVVIANSTEQQHDFLSKYACVDGAAEQFENLVKANHSHLAQELWKYCALFLHGGIYLDSHSPILRPFELKQLILGNGETYPQAGIAVLMDSFAPSSIHGSILFLRNKKSQVALEAAKILVDTEVSVLKTSPLLLPRTFYDLVATDVAVGSNNGHDTKESLLESGVNGNWYMLLQSCSENPFRQTYYSDTQKKIDAIHTSYSCSPYSGFCCLIYDGAGADRTAILGLLAPIQPIHKILYSELPKPFQTRYAEESDQGLSLASEELPYIATLTRVNSRTDPEDSLTTVPATTFHEHLKQKECLPSTSCNKCLSDKKHGANCETCLEACPCYCKALCHDQDSSFEPSEERFQDFTVSKPIFARDPTRIIPRIVHQTWFEDLNPDKYPNMSRLTESFKTSGWEYRFYTDDTAGSFLSEHFPPQVREAYDLLIPGAFRADLFRYCVLLIRGGVYADVDTMMGPSLDAAIPNDVGFMVGLDEPGKRIGKRMCLWNGFIASAPGHPFLAKVIESIVNNVHRRFTSVDMARMHCPSPEMSIITSFSPLFVAGPCMLGSTINTVLGRHGQTQFEAGELNHSSQDLKIPGRTIILDQNKMDMGAHRFTFLERNLIVLSTDFPDSDDREKLDGYEHYSKTRIKFEIYGVDGVYKNTEKTTKRLMRLNLE